MLMVVVFETSMLMGLIFWIVDVDGVDILGC
jgi:preprotein translocase subunit SecE